MTSPVTLVIPPWAKACEPTPGPLVLAGHLRAQGIRVRLVDANLEVQEKVFSSPTLTRCVAQMAADGTAGRRLTSARRAARRVDAAWEALIRPDTYRNVTAYRTSLATLEEAARALSRVRGARFALSDLEPAGLSPLSSGDLLQAARDPGRVALREELETIAHYILGDDRGLVGVSATYLSQALPAFALAGLLRRLGYRGRLVLGGGLVSSWAARLGPASSLFEIWDALVVGPGEGALTALVGEADLSGTPGLLAPGLGVWNPAPEARRGEVSFALDIGGLPWGRYLSPGPVLPIATSRGCYWRRCAFCPESTQDRQPFRQAPPGALPDEILHARDALGAAWVHLTDNAVPPATLRRLARGLRGEGVRWYGFSRLEPALLDPGFAADLARGGCAMLQLGVETASQRLLDRMGKGTRAADAGPILANLAAAGIRTYVYLLFGIPTETEAEAQHTLAWAAEHADSVTFLNLALMNLPRGSTLERAAAPPGSGTLPPEDLAADLSLYRDPRPDAVLERRRAREALTRARALPSLRRILARTPPGLTSNHAAFAPLADAFPD